MTRRNLLLFFFSIPFLIMSQKWESSFASAQKKAIASGKALILVFSGSDWCAPCIKLDRNVWQSNSFRTYAAKNYVLYKADFPRKKKNRLAKEIMIKNKELAERYNPKGFFPLVLVLDKKLRVLGEMSYKGEDSKTYIELLDVFL